MSFNLSKFFKLPKLSMPKILKNINVPKPKFLRKNKIRLDQTTNTNTNRVLTLSQSGQSGPVQKLTKKVSDDTIKETNILKLKDRERYKFLQEKLKQDPKFKELENMGLVEINTKYGLTNMIQFQYPYRFKGNTLDDYLKHKEAFLELNSNFTKRMENDYKITDNLINPSKSNKRDTYKSIQYQITSDPEYRMLKEFGVITNPRYGINGRFVDNNKIRPAFVIDYTKVGNLSTKNVEQLKKEVKQLNSSMNKRFYNEIKQAETQRLLQNKVKV